MPPLPEYPFAGRFFAVPGGRMHYLDEGPQPDQDAAENNTDAPPVVMVHGNPTWSYYYRRLVLALRGRFRCLAPDHVGMGLSDKPTDAAYEYTLSRRVDDLGTWLDAVEPARPVTLVVHDWGGMIGLAWAVRNPGRVARIIALNTAGFPLPAGKRLPWSLRMCRTPIIGPLLVQGLNLFAHGAATHCVTRAPLPRDVRRAYLSPYDSWSHRRAVLRFVQDIPLSAHDKAWPIVEQTANGLLQLASIPLMVIWGRRDFVFDDAFLAEWRRRFPHAEFHPFGDAGHYILEDAHEEVIPLIERFVSGER